MTTAWPRAGAIAAALVALSSVAHARVEMPTKGAIAMSMGEAQVFGDAMTFASTSMPTATAEAIIKDQIAEAHAAGVRMFWYDAKNNGDTANWRANRWNAAARAFNAANPTAKVCIIPSFRTADAGNGSTTGALPLFDAIDAGAGASPMCEKGGKPVVATIGATCINPLTVLSARGPFVVLAGYEADPWVPPSACVTTLKGAGASSVYAAITTAASTPAFSTASMITTTQNAATAAGADGYILGIGNARSSACGIGGNGQFTGDVSMTDMNYWQHLLAGGREAATRGLAYIVYTAGFSGDTPRGSYLTTARVCDPRDRAVHNVDVGGINRGFSCPNVPDDFKAAIPASFDRSLSLPYWTRPGMVEAAKVWNAWIASGTEPSTATPWVGFAYRQHPYGLAGTWQICSGSAYSISSSSVGGAYQGDYIALTSWAATPIKVRVKLAGATLFDGTLPAKQMALADVAQAQTKVAIGGRVGRPIIEILNDAGAVISSKEGLLAITNTPKHWGGQTGRNLGLYADFVPFASDIGFRGVSLGTTGKITSNLVHDIAGIGIETRGLADDVDVVGNTVSGAKIGIGLGSTAGAGRGRSMATVNNIVVGSTALGIGASGEVATDAIYANNLLNGNAVAMQQGIAAVAAGTITGAPAFASSTNFHLQSSSPARGGGLAAYSTGTDRDGRARKVPQDIGAYEFYDPAARTPCEDAGAPPVDPCDPGGADYPCNTEPPVVDTCIPAPALTSPTAISVGAAGGTWTLGRDEDAMVTCQDLVVTKTITIIGGNKVHVRGCEVVLGWDVAAALNREALKLVGMREAYVEGSIFDANDRCDAVTVALKGSGIAYDNSATKLTLVNVWTGNNNYNQLDGACAGNCVDVQGDGQTGQIDIYADRLTCVSKGEGIFVPDRQPTGDNIVNLKRTNVRFGPNGVPRFNVYRDGALLHLYFSGWEGMNENIQVRLDTVYSDWTQSNRNVGPGPATGDDASVDFTDPNLIRFKKANFVGVINKGVPTAGDFAPRAKLGRVYNRAEFCN